MELCKDNDFQIDFILRVISQCSLKPLFNVFHKYNIIKKYKPCIPDGYILA